MKKDLTVGVDPTVRKAKVKKDKGFFSRLSNKETETTETPVCVEVKPDNSVAVLPIGLNNLKLNG